MPPIKRDYEFALIEEIQNQSSMTEDKRRSRRTATREEEEETVLIPRSFLLHSSFEDAVKGIHSFSHCLLHSFGVLTSHSFELEKTPSVVYCCFVEIYFLVN